MSRNPRYGRVYIDPREDGLQVDDLITISDIGLYWKITKISKHGGTTYVRSHLGNRFGTINTSIIKSVWRDPNYVPEIDWTQAYDSEEVEENE
jgi:hypothetical protein